MKAPFIFVIFYFLTTYSTVHGAITMEQIKATGALLRQSCQPRFKLTDAQADEISNGKLPDYKDGKCYLNCLMEMLGVVKKGKIQIDKAIKSAETMLPPELKDDFIKGINACKDIPLTKDPCENAYVGAKCSIENNPKFFLP
ncbi:general odorant-binding protein 72-like [Culicoides brevitarsis]|uniref:general odorant-binding protein 72-like n=1 Tax=Culicoides brevitarsis TaxID=469753 RepID=UPI00307C77CC